MKHLVLLIIALAGGAGVYFYFSPANKAKQDPTRAPMANPPKPKLADPAHPDEIKMIKDNMKKLSPAWKDYIKEAKKKKKPIAVIVKLPSGATIEAKKCEGEYKKFFDSFCTVKKYSLKHSLNASLKAPLILNMSLTDAGKSYPKVIVFNSSMTKKLCSIPYLDDSIRESYLKQYKSLIKKAK